MKLFSRLVGVLIWHSCAESVHLGFFPIFYQTKLVWLHNQMTTLDRSFCFYATSHNLILTINFRINESLQVILSNSLAKMAESSVILLQILQAKLNTLLISEMQLAMIKRDKGLFHLKKLDKKNHGPDVKKELPKKPLRNSGM